MTNNYVVLARKYRPQTFAELIGQQALVRTLTNAIKTNRVHHAYLLTGIRGVGKTTTARIIAKALNCLDPQDYEPCGKCQSCTDIAADRHIDIIEMDAASNTGVDDVREIIENAKYAPNTAKYKVYIIDEVHMLSKNAFNALLKTLEEPPSKVIFIFATTELRKVPVTILSRCQKFDLARVSTEQLIEHLQNIAAKEGIEISADALKMIVTAGEGSVRDSLSLLDQAIAYSNKGEGSIQVDDATVRQMIGMADKQSIFHIFEAALSANLPQALKLYNEACKTSAEPKQIIRDLLEVNHLVTRIKITPQLDDATYTKDDTIRAGEFASKLSISVLSYAWQILLKGMAEVDIAPNPKQAGEMVLIRLAHMTTLPDPSKLSSETRSQKPEVRNGSNSTPESVPTQSAPTSFAGMVEMFKVEPLLYARLKADVSMVSYKPPAVEVSLSDNLPSEFVGQVAAKLKEFTGQNWLVTIVKATGQSTLKQQAIDAKQRQINAASEIPVVANILKAFDTAKVVEVEDLNKTTLDNNAANINNITQIHNN